MTISYSYGIMDLFHYGHLKALQQAARDADLHVVGLLSDKAATDWLGNIVSNEQERRAVLESISCVNWVMPQAELDPTDNIKKLHHIYPDAVIMLYRGDDIASIAAREYLKSIGGRIQSIDYYARLSPTEILNTLNGRVQHTERHGNIISTKAGTLQVLQERVHRSTIEQLMIVKVGEVRRQPEAVAAAVSSQFGSGKIVIRSSSRGEDGFETSNAGHYESILGVLADNTQDVVDALVAVYRSYGKDGEVADDEQILVQSQTEDVRYSGVCFTRDIQSNRPYYVVNYDDTGSTDMVTSGGGGNSLWIAQNAEETDIPAEWRNLFMAVRELESVLTGMLLDIEFAVKNDGSVVIFQVRPLAASYKFGRNASVQQVIDRKNTIRRKYADYRQRTGHRLLSDMAFWNPSEIIGDNPHRLDYSLYRDIITHRAWNDGLVPMGYRKVSADLMTQLGNKPYISVENSFLSLIPSSLDKELAQKLCNYYCDRLNTDFSTHDKIEFEIVFSCFDFSTEERLRALPTERFSASERESIRESLYRQTQDNILHYDDTLRQDETDLLQLETIRQEVEAFLNGADRVYQLADALTRLLTAIRQYGTPQFSRQARFAFIAKSLAQSLRERGFWTDADYDAFMSTVETVATQFERDFSLLAVGRLSRKEFNDRYGHLRAGTYDIRTPRYDRMDFTVQMPSDDITATPATADTQSAPVGTDQVAKAIGTIGWDISADALLAFMKTALEQREYFKFVFTKSLSRAIEIVAEIGLRLGISREELSYLDITEIQAFSLYNEEARMREYIDELLPMRKEEYRQYSQVILPNVLVDDAGINFVQPVNTRPNFITTKTVQGEVVVLDGTSRQSDLEGKIVVIEKADPGYDWIFAHNIGGLITKYGGVASHMAIRCAEFEIPAAIGCGSKLFAYAAEKQSLVMDCKKGIIAT